MKVIYVVPGSSQLVPGKVYGWTPLSLPAPNTLPVFQPPNAPDGATYQADGQSVIFPLLNQRRRCHLYRDVENSVPWVDVTFSSGSQAVETLAILVAESTKEAIDLPRPQSYGEMTGKRIQVIASTQEGNNPLGTTVIAAVGNRNFGPFETDKFVECLLVTFPKSATGGAGNTGTGVILPSNPPAPKNGAASGPWASGLQYPSPPAAIAIGSGIVTHATAIQGNLFRGQMSPSLQVQIQFVAGTGTNANFEWSLYGML